MNKPPLLASRAVLGLLACLTAGSALAHELPKDFSVPGGHPTGHVQKPRGMTWPPQPPGIRDIRDFSQPAAELARKQLLDQRFNELEGIAARTMVLRNELGRRRTRLFVSEDVDSAGNKTDTHYHYFDRDSSTTQIITRSKEGRHSLKKIAAREYQPEITEEEADEAVSLARTHFANLGHARVNQLKGFGILAYKPEGAGFFDTRVLYVSFHANDDAAPEYVAWVDLCKQSILAGRKEQ